MRQVVLAAAEEVSADPQMAKVFLAIFITAGIIWIAREFWKGGK